MMIEENIEPEKNLEMKKKKLELAEKYKETFKDLTVNDNLQQEMAIIEFRKLSEAGTDTQCPYLPI